MNVRVIHIMYLLHFLSDSAVLLNAFIHFLAVVTDYTVLTILLSVLIVEMGAAASG